MHYSIFLFFENCFSLREMNISATNLAVINTYAVQLCTCSKGTCICIALQISKFHYLQCKNSYYETFSYSHMTYNQSEQVDHVQVDIS